MAESMLCSLWGVRVGEGNIGGGGHCTRVAYGIVFVGRVKFAPNPLSLLWNDIRVGSI